MSITTSLKVCLIAGVLCLTLGMNAQKAPQTLILDGEALAKNQQEISVTKNSEKIAAYKRLLKDADKIVQEGVLYSVMHKKQTPPSGDKHDYMSQAPYWWPDPTKPDGLPYIKKDGLKNPELKDIPDTDEMDKIEDDAQTTAVAYFFSKDERYATHAAKLIKTWFLDKETKQNPNLNFSQGIPGINKGRGIGIIESRELYKVIDAAILLRGSKSWSEDDHTALKQWFSEFLTWLIESPIGKDEAKEPNNHGNYYNMQVINFALFTEQKEVALKQIDIAKKLIIKQITPEGSQPLELARTKSWDYVNMNLLGYCFIARLGDKLKADVWHFETADGKSIRKCVDWLMPYLKKEKKWAHEQIKKITYEETLIILKMSAKAYAQPAYDNLAKTVDEATNQKPLYQLAF